MTRIERDLNVTVGISLDFQRELLELVSHIMLKTD